MAKQDSKSSNVSKDRATSELESLINSRLKKSEIQRNKRKEQKRFRRHLKILTQLYPGMEEDRVKS